VKITEKGQVTIPIEERIHFGLFPSTEVQFERLKVGDKEFLTVVKKPDQSRGWNIVNQMRGAGNKKQTTAEILNLTRDREI
jgi:bifunctional DNA-binding transcriptional regulator/antitoxin component of YhaV-PrlF toxin-antitoxin module